jgi:diguanylate cyclase (GGDEF)-like protein
MGFFNKLKEFTNQITEVENNIHSNKQDFLEIFERNAQLEEEIAIRTHELDVANQRMLSLQHIWEMMNSTTPLSSVLETIVKSLQGELGYLHSFIMQKKEDDNGTYLKAIAVAKDAILEKTNTILGPQFHMQKLNYDPNGVFSECLCDKRIIQTMDLRSFLKSLAPELGEDQVHKMLHNANTRSIILVPICQREKDFGWLIVFSSRDSATEGEIDFLKLFAKQIETAITIADLFQAVKQQAVTDGLTGLYNRRYFEESLQREAERAGRMKQPFTIIGLDLDYLKQINDKYGHSFGDLAIQSVANVLSKNARSIDVAARLGGEEFNLLLPGVDSKGGMIAAERVRAAISECKLDKIGKVTASIGVATFLEHSTDVDELMEITDQAMYSAKRNGRNQVQMAKPLTETPWQEIAINTFTDILQKRRIPIAKEISLDLSKKLTTDIPQNVTPKEMLYSVADMLAKTYNPEHSDGTTRAKVIMAKKIAQALDLSEEEQNKLKVATVLYDIGNLMVPKDVLQKTEPLTEDEKSKIKEHPIIAAREILKPISEVEDIIPIIEHHHENWDGTGYPNKKSGEEIPIASQIILIVDAYFALIQPRAYRHAMLPQDALEEIKNDSSKKWNPELVTEFVSLVESEIKVAN